MKADLRTTDTKERIITEARKLYQFGGYNHLSLDLIARSLNITRPAIYFHFPGGKDQLLVEVLKLWGAEVAQHLESAIRENQDTRSRLRSIMFGVTNHPLPDDREIMLAKLNQLTEQAQKELQQLFFQINQIITGVIQEGICNGELRPVEPSVAFFSFMGLCQQVEQYPILRQQLPSDFACQFPMSVEQMVDKLLDLWFQGIVMPCTT